MPPGASQSASAPASATSPAALPPHVSSRHALITCSALAALVFALCAASRSGAPFSDSLLLASLVERGPWPYYNVLYLPLGHAWYAAGEPLFGWSALAALEWFSALGAALCAAACCALALLVGCGPLVSAALALALACTPGALFFGATGEVHALASASCAFALCLAWHARSAPAGRAFAWLAGAVLVLVLGHLVHIALVPALLVLASCAGRGPSQAAGGLGRPPLALVRAALCAALVLALVFWALRPFFSGGGQIADPARVLGSAGTRLASRASAGHFFGLHEVLDYVWVCVLAPAGWSAPLALLGAMVAAARRSAPGVGLACALALAPYVLLLPQTGVREEGAYSLSLEPFAALAVAAGLATLPRERKRVQWAAAAALCALAALSLPRGRALLADARARDRALEFGAQVARVARSGDQTYALGIPRAHAAFLAAQREGQSVECFHLPGLLELVPEGQREDTLDSTLAGMAAALARGSRLWFDADFLSPQAGAHAERFQRALEQQPVRFEAAGEDAPLLLELRLR
jgi:hypothetical protein